jgi:UDP-N-acetylenolpyruvoylglucosamine reductase
MEASKDKRRSSQPVAASAGCIFKNPEGIGAGQLVDEMGLKESGVGGAMVSAIHGNFIVNENAATARDVLDLIAGIKKKALDERGIELETEVQVIGQDDPI